MLSRVANNLFWMDRYMERSYGLINLIKTNYNSTIDSGDYSSWGIIMKSYMGQIEIEEYENYMDSISAIEFMIFDTKNPNTLINILNKSRENARSVQEHISKELWLSINTYYLYISKSSTFKKLKKSNPIIFLNDLLKYNHIYYSTADISQERGNAYCFMCLGKYIERVAQSIDFLSVRILDLDEEKQNFQDTYFWKNLLTSIGGYQLYIKTYKSIFSIENIIEMITINEYFPRSIFYSIEKLNIHIKRLNEYNKLSDKKLNFKIGKLRNDVKYTTLETLKKRGIKEFLREVKFQVNQISEFINQIYFSLKV